MHVTDATHRVGLSLVPSGFDGVLDDFVALGTFELPEADFVRNSSVFIDESGEVIPHEFANREGDFFELWLRFSEVESGQEKSFWLYWGDGPLSIPNAQDVWATPYRSAYHFNRINQGSNSAVLGSETLECVAGTCGSGAGVVGSGLDATEGGLIGELPEDLRANPGEKLTISVWYTPTRAQKVLGPLVYSEAFCNGWQLALVESTGMVFAAHSVDNEVIPMDMASTCVMGDFDRAIMTTPYTLTQTDHHVVFSIDRSGGELALFLDGVSVGTVSVDTQVTGDFSRFEPKLRIGTQGTGVGNLQLEGAIVDEVILLKDAVSPNWVLAHYHNLKTWRDGSVVGPVETKP